MKCRLPMKIGTPSGGGGVALPDGAFVPVTKFTDGRTYALVAKIDGVYRYINTTTYNDWTMNATEVAVTEKSGYVLFGSEPALFTAKASGDGFTLANGSNFLHGTSSGGTALRVGTTSAVWKVDTSETGGFDSGKYLPKEVSSSVWLKNTANNYDWSIKYESGNKSFGYDRAGRDNTYSTGFVSFILYEKYEGGSGGSDEIDSAIIMVGEFGTYSDLPSVKVNDTTYTTAQTIEVEQGTEVTVAAIAYNSNTSLIYHDGVQVGSTTYSITQYKFTFTSTVTITSTYHSNNGTYDIYRIDITTEGSSGGGGGGDDSLDYHDNFADNDWATIAKVCAEGLTPTTWKVGDQKTMIIANATYTVDIIGINHDTFTDGGTAPFTFQLHDCYNTTYGMNSSDTNTGGWRDSAMRSTSLVTILNSMPFDVQPAIKAVNKSTALTAGSTTQTITSDKLFLLSEWEALGVTNWSGVEEGKRYAYYANGGATIKNVNGTASQWWCRSIRGGGSTNQFAGVNTTGTTTSIRASRTMGVSFAFCLGNPVE